MSISRSREYALSACALSAYFLIQLLSSRSTSCDHENSSHGIPSYFENDVLLEFEKFGFDCTSNLSKNLRCSNGILMNSTRIVVNGRTWQDEDIQAKSFINSDLDGTETGHRKEMKRLSLITDKTLDTELRPRFQLLSCEDMEKLFVPDKKKEDLRSTDDIVVTNGKLLHPLIGMTPCLRKQASKSSGDAFMTLNMEKEKRIALGTDTRLTSRLIGICNRQDDLTIIIEDISETTAICEDEKDQETMDYSNSRCFRNEELIGMIERSPDKTRSAFAFIKEIICLFSEMEKKGFFAQDIHGKHISVTSNFSVLFNNVDVLSHHGSRNILSGSTCKYDENCPAPSGLLWNNGSANRVVYEKCKDPLPLCSETSCTGFNSSLHMCGISRWLLQPLYSYFERIQDRSRITSIMMASMNGWPFLRRSAVESCRKAIVYLGLYDKDKKLASGVLKQKKSFHLGPMQAKNRH